MSLRKTIVRREIVQKADLGAAEATIYAELRATRDAMEAAMVAADLRYQQRFEAQSDALAAAFLSQQTAMQTAFMVAEKAVQAALAAADRAVSKAELAADKRFEALNELRQMLNDMVVTLMTRQEAIQRFDGTAEKIEAAIRRLEVLEGRVNTLAGQSAGAGQAGVERRATLATTMQITGGVVGIAVLFVILWRVFTGN